MTHTDIANLALSKIGESLIADIADTGDKNARKASLHYEPALRETLRAHFWGFALVVVPLPKLISYWPVAGAGEASVNGNYRPFGTFNGKAAYSKDGTDSYPKIRWNVAAANEWSISTADYPSLYMNMDDTVTPDYAAGALFWNALDSPPAPTVVKVDLAPGMLGWQAAFTLPADFIKLRKVFTEAGAAVDAFALRRVDGSRCILTGDYETISLEYVQFLDEPDDYDPLFLAAFATLLASRLARAITGNEKLESQLLGEYEGNALLKARLADGHDSQSNENHPLQEILDGALINSHGNFFHRL